MKKSSKQSLFRWLNSEDLMQDAGIGEIPHYDPLVTNPHTYEAEAHALKTVEAVEERSFQRFYVVLCIALILFFTFVLLLTVSHLPRAGAAEAPVNNQVSSRYIEKGLEETGATNLVAGMILDYRAFDTLGESHVLFTAMCAVVILLAARSGDKQPIEEYNSDLALFDTTKDPILRSVAFFLVPCLLVYGIYVLLNGHLSPGGGFSGGTILGAAFILYAMAFGFDQISRFMNAKSIKAISCCALGFYVLAKSYSFFTGANHLPSIISTGTPGAILSAGLILPLNVSVGLVVACTMYSFFSLFKRGGL